ncbi:MAG: hypothetical protein JXN59_11140 [Anaerolineae bacterium]|nr:hypothetical protein [Anaerolineae bacterium]
MATAIKWILLAALVMHGIGHVIGFLGAWTQVPVGTNDSPWLLGGGVTLSSPIGKVFGLVWLAALALFVAAGVGLYSGQAWWPGITVIAAIVSLVAIVPFWRAVPSGAQSGGVLFDLLLLALLLPGWKEQVIAYLQ